ncbi:DUF4097 family beta strand repeat-containing protein [Paenibacillus sp. FSL K6-2859]|uniref:DUF4097 family beta strand repeat-containing protein n=1 Tax=Paenibacillus sp. FSL K6-2859 TaxID=2921482 RepID=UPI0030F9F1EF
MLKKIFSNTAAVTVTLSLALFATACTTNSSADKQGNSTPYEQKSYSVDAGKVNQISLSTTNRKIELVQSTDNEIHIDYFENNKESYELNVTDDKKLVMEAVSNKQWKDYIGLDSDKTHRDIKIAIPNHTASDITLNTSKGDIVVSELNIAGSVHAKTSDGKIDFSNVEMDKDLNIETKNDHALLSGVSVKGSIDATLSNGDLEVTKVVVGDTLKMKAKNGDITGTVIGSYDVFDITSKASKGKNNLPESKSGGDKKLEVSTNNGDIDLTFVD